MIKIVLIILGMFLILVVSSYYWRLRVYKKAKEEANEILGDVGEAIPEIVTAEDLEGLPEPVQRYLKYTQIIGKEKITTVRLEQGGYFSDERRSRVDANKGRTVL
ncbi:MAG: hypothetical protein H0Z19_06780 [Archaeoglobus sp.]|uniref:DUF6544 family protein n=1 Tax=Archaeoglobus sp. TaxID=1872626 RepID=UPI001D735128|nr:DUF6544 family protein [Archaeoglobus sp.]MBO8180172.1 hypothetical protein [Archaeoglobus sp.]